MTTAHVYIATSLDGFIARPDGDIGWLTGIDTGGADMGYDSFAASVDGIVMGRETFAKVLTFGDWPHATPVIVASRTLAPGDLPAGLAGRVEISALPPAALLGSLAARGWSRVYLDGGRLVQSFLREGLVEDITLTVAPVLLGAGRPLFGALPSDVALELIGVDSFPGGFVQSRYRLRREAARGAAA